MQRTIQLDISTDIFDKVMFWLENLPKNKVKLKETKEVVNPSNDEYFSSKIDRYIFALTELDGTNRQKILGITPLHYRNNELANKWKKEIAFLLHPDKCSHPKAKEAWAIMNDIYSEMVSE
jgi:hypothetical protein